MIAVKAPKLAALQREFKLAPGQFQKAMTRAISTTRRDMKADATKIAQGIYTAGRNKISQALTTSNVDRKRFSFILSAKKKGLSLVDFTHQASVAKKKRGVPVRVQVLRAGGFSSIEDSFKKRGSITGKMRIMQYQKSGPLSVIALASSSVADMLNRQVVRDKLEFFAGSKMKNELARQIALVFK